MSSNKIGVNERRRSTSSRNYHQNDNTTNDAANEPSYVHVTVEPLLSSNSALNSLKATIALTQSFLPSSHSSITSILTFTAAIAVSAYIIFTINLPYFLLRTTFLSFSLFSISCIFCWFAIVFRHSWTASCAYVLFCACVIGEIASRLVLTFEGPPSSLATTSSCPQQNALIIQPYNIRPSELLVFLLAVITAISYNYLSSYVNLLLIILVTVVRYIAYAVLVDIPCMVRPYVAYIAGISGIIAAKHAETIFTNSVLSSVSQDGKLIAVKRRRTSSSLHAAAHSSLLSNVNTMRNRRTSLPALSIQKTHGTHLLQSSSSSLDIALLSEAHGLISDMLADKTLLPPHIVSGLQALSNLLSPPNHMSPHQPRQRAVLTGAMVSLTDFSGSDTEENLPYTGERPSALPKRFKKNVPQSLLRRMSTSTWTTTTSATGMPTLEPEPCRKRSTSFRHHPPEISPTSGLPTGGMSSSLSLPSSISNTPAHCGTPTDSSGAGTAKGRSFSTTAAPITSSPLHRKCNSVKGRERKTVCSFHPLSVIELKQLQDEFAEEKTAVQQNTEVPSSDTNDASSSSKAPVSKLNQGKCGINTSDYDSCESPCGSEIFENNPSSESSDKSSETFVVAKDRIPDAEILTHVTQNSSNYIPHVSISSDKPDSTNNTKNNNCQVIDFNELSLHPYGLESYPNHHILDHISEWDYPIFELESSNPNHILSMMCHRVFLEVGLFETFKIPMKEFLNYFHILEGGYRDKPYHNRMHAADVLHAVYYLTSQPIPGFVQMPPDFTDLDNKSDTELGNSPGLQQRQSFIVDDSYGVMGANIPALELMALYTAAAMHDYDHPGRTNAFLVTVNAPLAVLYNDRSVLENHHAAAAWSLFMSDSTHNFLQHLDKAEFKRFRFLVIEFILATDLKRHFEILTEFNAKVNIDDAPGIDWQSEADRMLVMQMCIKLADINGPCKRMDLHTRWTQRIAEEFYEQGDEENAIGLPVSPFMDRKNPQLAKLQESFINHLVAPLCNAYGESGLLPGQWVESADTDDEDSEVMKSETDSKDTEDEGSYSDINSDTSIQRHLNRIPAKKVICLPAKHIQDNYDYWIKILKDEAKLKDPKKSPNNSRSPSPSEETFSDTSSSTIPGSRKGSDEMETIHEEDLHLPNNHLTINSLRRLS